MGGVSSTANSRQLPQKVGVASQQTSLTNYKINIEGTTEEVTFNREVTYQLSLTKVEEKQDENEREGDTTTADDHEDSEPDVVVQLGALADNTIQEAAVTCTCRTEPYTYTVSYTPHVRGRCVVTVNIGGTQVATQEVCVRCPPEIMATIKPVEVSCMVNTPSKINVDEDGNVFVLHVSNSSRTSEIAHLSKKGRLEKPITSKYKSGQVSMFEFSNWNPQGIATDDNKNLYIAHMHTLDKLGPKGELLASVNFEDARANSPEVAHCLPEGMRFHKDRLYVCNGYNNTVLIFDADLNLRQTLKTGRVSKNLQEPHDIDIDQDGNIYIADICAHKVFVYTSDGQFTHAIGSHGKSDGQLEKPVSLVVDLNYVYVAEETNHRVSVFKTSGEFVCSFQGEEEDGSQMQYPSDIAMDRDGFLYLCDRRNRILKY